MQFLAVQYKDKALPKEWLADVLAKLETCKTHTFSLAYVNKDEGGVPRVTVVRDRSIPPLDQIMDTLAITRDDNTVLLLEGDVQNVLDDDLQPFEMFQDHDGRTASVAFALGEYPNVKAAGSSHTPYFHVLTEKVRPKMVGVYDVVENSLDDYCGELASKVLVREMENLGTEVFIAILSATEPGHVQGFMKNMHDAKEFDFGYVTDHLGYGQPKEEAEPEPEVIVEPVKPANMMDKLRAAMGSKPKAEDKVPVTTPVQKPVSTGPKEAPQPDQNTQVDQVQCPVGLSNGKAKEWYKLHAGWVPTPPKGTSLNLARPIVPVRKARSMQDLGKVQTSTQAVGTAFVKDTTAHNLPVKPPAENKPTTDTPVPVIKEPITDPNGIPENQLKALHNSFFKIPEVLKTFDSQSEEILPPDIAAEMVDYPTVNMQIGLDGGIERWKGLRRKYARVLAVMAPSAAGDLISELNFNLWNTVKALAEANAKLGAKDAVVVHSLAKQELKPATPQEKAVQHPAKIADPITPRVQSPPPPPPVPNKTPALPVPSPAPAAAKSSPFAGLPVRKRA